MYTVNEYVRAASLKEAYEANQKPQSRIIGGNMWLRLGRMQLNRVIDLSGLGLNEIRETEAEFVIGCMTSLRQLERHPDLNACTGGAVRECLKDIVGTQFRNTATIGGTIWGRFGFSDVLPCFLAMGGEVELYKGGRLPLADFAQLPYDKDILVQVILPKTEMKVSYQALRNAATDFPVVACCVAAVPGHWRISIGARPGKAVLYTAKASEVADEGKMQEFIDRILAAAAFGTNTRASKEYRRAMAEVLIKRAIANIQKQG